MNSLVSGQAFRGLKAPTWAPSGQSTRRALGLVELRSLARVGSATLRRVGSCARAAFNANAVQTELNAEKRLAEPDQFLADARAVANDTWPDPNTVLRYTGEGLHLGVKCAWSLLLRADGAFVDECRSPTLRSVVGYDGSDNSQCWEVDGMGVPKHLELDDHEHCLMSNWVRSGFWLRTEAMERLEVLAANNDKGERTPEMQHHPDGPATTSAANGSTGDRRMLVRVKGGQIVGEVSIGAKAWQPESLMIKVLGKVDTHTFTDWAEHDGHCFPRSYRLRAAAGSENSFRVISHETVKPWQSAVNFAIPETWLRPPDTRFDPPAGGSLPAWWTSSGHIVVQPKINGRELGYMILDTGASGFVIESTAADRLGMARFGKFHCSGMMDNVEICLRRSNDFSLGPLTIKEPLFMEMQLGGLVRGAPGQVIGIVGYDVFRRCVMDIPFTADKSGRMDIQVHDPAAYQAPAELQGFWHTLEFVSSLPLIKAHISVDGSQHSVRLMIDSGAGGVDLMFNQRATDELKLLDHIPCSTRLIKGVGGSSTEKQRVKSGVLPWLQVSESRFDRLDCLFIGSAGLDLSHYVQGIVCGELVARCRTVLDFARRRIALVPSKSGIGT